MRKLITSDFTFWLATFKDSKLSYPEIENKDFVYKQLPIEDLICILYFGSDVQAIRSLRELQWRYDIELFELDQQKMHQEMEC